MPTISPNILERLRTFDTPTICNIVELFEVRPRNVGYMDARIKACFPEMPPMVGFAATATFRSAAPPRGQGGYASVSEQIERFSELSGPAVVVFQDLDEPSAAATFGEVMCTTYKTFGATGLITSGTGRDLDQVRAIHFPVFTNGACCSHGYVHIPQIHLPVHVGGIAIYPDDLLHGDCNGVTTIPHEIAAEVADIGEEFVAAEAIILASLRGESPSLQTYNDARAHAGTLIADMRQRVSRAKK
jgi:regulator of RNase E activity RraA